MMIDRMTDGLSITMIIIIVACLGLGAWSANGKWGPFKFCVIAGGILLVDTTLAIALVGGGGCP